MAEAQYNYVCYRCGHEYSEIYDPDWGPKELTCPSCRSNSVRRLPLDRKDKEKK